MTTLLVQHTVESFKDWKVAFDNHESNRRLHGSTGHRLMRDENAITVLLDFPDAASAQAFTADPSLKEAMAKGGVIGTPTVSSLEGVESVRY